MQNIESYTILFLSDYKYTINTPVWLDSVSKNVVKP